MRKKIFLFLFVSILFVFSACTSTGYGDLNLLSKNDSGKIVMMTDAGYDWKDIPIQGGTVAHEFLMKNDGEDDLILKGANTSCMCTTATIELPNGKLSPTFAMHQNNDWAYAIKPGEEFKVNVVFDPMAHGPDAVGPIDRTVRLFSSSEGGKGPVVEMRLKGNVIR